MAMEQEGLFVWTPAVMPQKHKARKQNKNTTANWNQSKKKKKNNTTHICGIKIRSWDKRLLDAFSGKKKKKFHCESF